LFLIKFLKQKDECTRQDKTRQDKTRQDKTRQDKTRQDKTRQDKTRQDKTRQDKTRQLNGLSSRDSVQNAVLHSHPKGFLSVVAMIIFAILVITGLSVQRANIDRLQNIRNSNNYMKAKHLSKSVMSYLQYAMKNTTAGVVKEFSCHFKDGALNTEKGITNSPECEEEFLKMVNPCTIEGNESSICKSGNNFLDEVSISAKINGRDISHISESCLSFSGGCYTVPALGEGTAGERQVMPVKNDMGRDCDLYNPIYTASDLDHECNWNRLSFGSTATDRVVIPLYYTDDEGNIVDLATGNINPHFLLRVRTPCKEWKDDGTCNSRYILDTGTNNSENDIVLQWQITGECEEDGKTIECGMLPWVDYRTDGTIAFNSSGISEDRINSPRIGEFIVLKSMMGTPFLRAIDTLTYSNNSFIFDLLKNKINKSSFVLFLNKPLIDELGERVPYLEYQLLTGALVSSPETRIEVSVNFNGNKAEQEIYQSISGALIDFAVQN
jgi:hypothetical protein